MRRDFTVLLVLLLVLICVVCTNAQSETLCVMSVQASGGLNVRAEPNINSKIVYLLDDTDTVIVRELKDGWALVARNDGEHLTIGWVSAKYLK